MEDRQLSLYHQFNFICCCDACENDYPMWEELKTFDDTFIEPEEPPSDPLEAIQKFGKNCQYIEDNFKNFPSYELCRLFQNNYKLLRKLSCD